MKQEQRVINYIIQTEKCIASVTLAVEFDEQTTCMGLECQPKKKKKAEKTPNTKTMFEFRENHKQFKTFKKPDSRLMNRD